MDTSTLGGSLEPKLKLSTYEWDDTKSGAPSFWQFMMAFSALVRMTLYGDIFEDLLDGSGRRCHHPSEAQSAREALHRRGNQEDSKENWRSHQP